MHRSAGILVVVLLVLAGCGSGEGGDAGDVPVTDVPADVPADAPPDVPADLPTDVPIDLPADAPIDLPADVPDDGLPADLPEEALEDVPLDVPLDLPEEAADLPVDAPDDTVEDAPTDVGPDGTAPDFGFDIRVPQQGELPQIDYVCTFPAAWPRTWLYVQNDGVSCGMMVGCQYANVGAWVSVDGVVQALAGVVYNYGGNHHNDSVQVPWQGQVLNYYHSSFGWGWRKCQPMDCVQVMNLSQIVLDDGCTPDRTIPVTCVEVDPTGAVPAFPVTFEKCPGDPNA